MAESIHHVNNIVAFFGKKIEKEIQNNVSNKLEEKIDHAQYNSFGFIDVRFSQEQSLLDRYLEIHRMLVGDEKTKGRMRFGLFDLLFAAPAFIATGMLHSLVFGVFYLANTLTTGFAFLLKKSLEKNIVTTIFFSPFLYALTMASALITAASYGVCVLGRHTADLIYLTVIRGLIPLLGFILSPISLAVASMVHAGYGMGTWITEKKVKQLPRNQHPLELAHLTNSDPYGHFDSRSRTRDDRPSSFNVRGHQFAANIPGGFAASRTREQFGCNSSTYSLLDQRLMVQAQDTSSRQGGGRAVVVRQQVRFTSTVGTCFVDTQCEVRAARYVDQHGNTAEVVAISLFQQSSIDPRRRALADYQSQLRGNRLRRLGN